jgi:glycosyltransferase involved in cell wall biosynthesis
VDRPPARILHVAHNIAPHVGGLEAVVTAETRGLQERGYDVTVVGSASPGSTAPAGHTLEDGVRVIRVPAWHGLEQRWGIPFPVFSPRLVTTLAREVRRADLVHVHDLLYLSSWVAALWCRLARTPYVVHRHVGFVHHPSRLVRLVQSVVIATFGRLVTGGARALVAIDDHVAASLETSPVPAHVLGNGVDTDLFRPMSAPGRAVLRARLGLPTERVLALFVGRFVPKKGFAEVLAAAGDDYDLVLAGGDRPADVTDPRVHFLGEVAPDQVAAAYGAVDLMIVASVGECPLTVLESMASGLPLLARDDPALHTEWTESAGVLFVDVAAGELPAALAGLADDAAARQRMGLANRAWVEARFSWSQHLDHLERLYRDL